MRTLIGLLLAGGLAGLIAWQAAPWLLDSDSRQVAPVNLAPTPSTPPTAHEPTAHEEGDRGVPPLPNEAAVSRPKPAQPDGRSFHQERSRDAFIWVSTVPADATVTLDDQRDAFCMTPCMLLASRGTHKITISRAGYQTEYSRATVTGGRLDLPLITMHAARGVLMVTSVPSGARIILNGHDAEQVTPASLQLPPGTHDVTIEKDGRRASQEVRVQDGVILYLKIPLNLPE